MTPTAGTLQAYLRDITDFVNVVVPVLFAVAFFFFIWNVARYFIIQGGSEDGREKAKRYMVYGLAALVILFSFWGIVNILTTLVGIGGGGAITPDYLTL